MGCDFKVYLQVLVGDYWITVVDFCISTGYTYSGYPLRTAYTTLLRENKDITGKYGTDYRALECSTIPNPKKDWPPEIPNPKGKA